MRRSCSSHEEFHRRSSQGEWLTKIKDEVMGFIHKTTIEILGHLEKIVGGLDYVDTNEIMKDRDTLWDTT